jgi:hypothetical protein
MNMDDNENIDNEEMDLGEDWEEDEEKEEDESDSSEDDDDSNAKEIQPSLVFENKLVGIILRREWQHVLNHLQTDAGQQESRSTVFANIIGESVPLHLIFLTKGYLPKGLRPPRRGFESFTVEQQDRTDNVPLDVVNALLDANSEALLTPSPGRHPVVHCAMEESADPEVIRAMLVAQPTTLAIRILGNTPIHDMIKYVDDQYLVMRYLKIVYDLKPECIMERNEVGQTAISYAFIKYRQRPILDFLLQSSPQLASMPLEKDVPDTFPIHHACIMRDYPCSVVDQLLHLHPEGLFLRDATLSLPINLFCQSKRRVETQGGYSETLDAMISMYPKSLLELDRHGRLPLHANTKNLWLFSTSESPPPSTFGDRVKAQQSLLDHTYQQVLECLPRSDNNIGDTNNMTDITGLHKAALIAHLFSPDAIEAKALFQFTVIRSLIGSSDISKLVLKQNDGGNTFLHLLWNKAAKTAVLQKHWKHTKRNNAQWRKQMGRPPNLDLDSWRSNLLDRIHLYDENRSGNYHGGSTLLGTVLDLLDENGVSEEHRRQLIRSVNQDQELPLHVALRFGRSNAYTREEVRRLLELYPDASHMTNIRGELPLHLALKHQCPSEVYDYVVMLLRVHPRASTCIDPEETLVPFMLAAVGRGMHGKTGKKSSSCLNSTFALLRNNPGII